MNAIANSAVIGRGGYRWTITNVADHRDNVFPYTYGRLAKYSGEGQITQVDIDTKHEIGAIAENLLIASSPFVYLPKYSGLAFLHVWNGVGYEIFPKRFQEIIEATYDNFFVKCIVEPVADYGAFSDKLRKLDRICELSAKVSPPNPLFGRLWEPLNDYIKERNAAEIKVSESQSMGSGIKSQLANIMVQIMRDSNYIPDEIPSFTDAAMLMAADGYGSGKVIGDQENERVIIRTADTQKSFLFPKEPHPKELAIEAEKHLRRVSQERDMKH